jgi:deazaflavin-dependent oxidoreductase (nitroreductase family)
VPIPKRVARFNERVTNRLTRHVAGRLPGFAIVSHVGRRSGRRYRTPVNVFRHGDRYLFALTYGADSNWVRNVMAGGGCEIETRGRTISLRDPELFSDAGRSGVPVPARWILGLLDVNQFLTLTSGPAMDSELGSGLTFQDPASGKRHGQGGRTR